MIASITIITKGGLYHSSWEESNGLTLRNHIFEECYGLVECNESAIVTAILFEQTEVRETGSNIPDERQYYESNEIECLTFLYNDQDESLDLISD